MLMFKSEGFTFRTIFPFGFGADWEIDRAGRGHPLGRLFRVWVGGGMRPALAQLAESIVALYGVAAQVGGCLSN